MERAEAIKIEDRMDFTALIMRFNLHDQQSLDSLLSKLTVIQPKLSIDELRGQFEKRFKGCDFRLNDSGQYWSFKVYDKWSGYQECARANNLIKDGE